MFANKELESCFKKVDVNHDSFKGIAEKLGLKEDDDLYDNILKVYIGLRLRSFFLDKKIDSFCLIDAPSHYYELFLSQRKEILKAPSVHYLCKSMIMENTAFIPEKESPYYKKQYCVVIQYTTETNADKLAKVLRDQYNENNEESIGKRAFHFRMIKPEESKSITGYGYNSVTPFCMKTDLPIIVSGKIPELKPQFFYLGGGHVDFKIRISFEDFMKVHPTASVLDDITDPKPWK